jgi:hypothetical protein
LIASYSFGDRITDNNVWLKGGLQGNGQSNSIIHARTDSYIINGISLEIYPKCVIIPIITTEGMIYREMPVTLPLRNEVNVATNTVDLFQLFQAVNQALKQNKSQLNQADTYNHDHGDNMVDIFNTITKVMQQNSTATPAEQLQTAASMLSTKQSGSAQYYSKSLNQAANELGSAKQVNADNATTLVQTLLGGGQANAQKGSAATDMLGSLLSSLGGASGSTDTASPSGKSTIDWATLANAGLEYMQSKQEGKDTLTALMEALMAEEPTKAAPYRKESGTIIANTLMQVLGTMLSKNN